MSVIGELSVRLFKRLLPRQAALEARMARALAPAEAATREQLAVRIARLTRYLAQREAMPGVPPAELARLAEARAAIARIEEAYLATYQALCREGRRWWGGEAGLAQRLRQAATERDRAIERELVQALKP